MTYDEFLMEIRRKAQIRLGRFYRVGLEKVLKNNNVVMDALCISRTQEEVRPTLYLNVYYKLYLESMTIDDILDEILEVYQWYERKR